MTEDEGHARGSGRERETIGRWEPTARRSRPGTMVPVPPFPAPTPSLDEVARLVATAARNETARRWCVLALAGALQPGVAVLAGPRQFRPDRGSLIVPRRSSAADRHGWRHDADAAREVRLPPSALVELASWTGAPWIGVDGASMRRRLERLQAGRDPRLRLRPSSFRSFVIQELRYAVPHLGQTLIEAWLGIRHDVIAARGHGFDRPDVTPVVEAVEAILLRVHERSGGVLLRAASAAGDGGKAG